MIDWEYRKNDSQGRPISVSDSVLWLSRAAGHCKKLWYPNGGRKPTIYTYPDFARQHQPFLGNLVELAEYPLTLASYPGLPVPPKPWTKSTIHQYAGNGGLVAGVKVPCDRDRFLGTEDEWRLFLGHRDESLVGSGDKVGEFPCEFPYNILPGGEPT